MLLSRIFIALFLIPITTMAKPGAPSVTWHAFVTLHYKGTVPVDEQGNPLDDGIDTVYTLLAEMKPADTASMQWKQVFVDGRWWQVATRHLGAGRQVIGYDREKEQEITLAPAAGNILVRLYLEPLATQRKPPADCLPGGLVVEGTRNKKQQVWRLPKPTALPAVHYP